MKDNTPENLSADTSTAALTGDSGVGKQWLHSFEEDTATETVYRPADWDFPPARRGRAGFALTPDGMLVERAIGPADRGVASPSGTWSLDKAAASESADAHRYLRLIPAGEPERILDIVSVMPDRLIVRKPSSGL